MANVLRNQNPKVLAGCNEVVLNSLSPQAPPSCSFETVIIGCISETAFEQVFSALAIALGGVALALGPCLIKFLLPVKTLNPPAPFGFRALRT